AGTLPVSAIDARVTATLATMLRFRIGALEEEPVETLGCDEHRALSLEAARKSAVLLRNEPVDGAPLLPLDPADIARVAVLGRFADVRNLGDGGSSDVMAPTVVTPFAGLAAALGHAEVVTAPADDLDATVAAATRADVAVVVVGFDREDEGEFIGGPGDNADLGYLMPAADDPTLVEAFERYVAEHHHDVPPELARRPDAVRFSIGGDRSSLRLRDSDVALLRAVAAVNPRTVVVLIAGSAVVTSEWDTEVPAILLAWYNGMEGGHAIADLLLGAANPGGRLPFVVPVDEGDLPPFDATATACTYDGLHGQWYLDERGVRPAHAFGSGLSYTHFDHAAERAEIDGDAVVVRATTFNAGSRDGADVVQVYVTRPAAPARARRRLGGFARVELAAGAAAEVTVRIPLRSLALRDTDTHSWVLPPGDYRFEVAHDAGDPAPLGVTLRLDGARWSR
ncbi:MAG: hypothetical protein RL531_1906, partial [Actinomycetota bacterium]